MLRLYQLLRCIPILLPALSGPVLPWLSVSGPPKPTPFDRYLVKAVTTRDYQLDRFLRLRAAGSAATMASAKSTLSEKLGQ